MVTSLIIGGTRGIGLVVSEHLLNRGDQVYTASRRTLEENNHISCDITKDCSCCTYRVKKLDTTSVNNIKAVSATRSVMINPGLTKKTFSSVSGTVTIIAPKNIKTITFAPEEINQEKNAVGNMVKIVKSEQVNEKTYNVKFEFNNNNTFLKTEAYDANGEKISSPSSSYNKGWRSMNFTSTPSKINIFVSESIEESTYPFLLKK